MKSIFTLGDARDEKRLMDARAEARDAARIAKLEAAAKVVRDTLRAYPEIGTLNSGKFYAYVGGYANHNYVESRDVRAVASAIDGARKSAK